MPMTFPSADAWNVRAILISLKQYKKQDIIDKNLLLKICSNKSNDKYKDFIGNDYWNS